MVKSGLEFFFYFEILRAPSEIPANLPGQDIFELGSSNSGGACRILKQKILDHFSPSFLSVSRAKILVHLF